MSELFPSKNKFAVSKRAAALVLLCLLAAGTAASQQTSAAAAPTALAEPANISPEAAATGGVGTNAVAPWAAQSTIGGAPASAQGARSNASSGSTPETAPAAAAPPPAGAPAPQPAGPAPAETRPHPYNNIPALSDLYSQAARPGAAPERFGTEVFRNGTGNLDQLPMDLPVGPDYVVGPGDSLSLELWGSTAQHLQQVVDREGRIALPEAGTLLVAGHTLGEVQEMVQKTLRSQFRDLHADVSLGRLRTVRIYVVGDVHRPGAYDVSALSTPLNALFVAGGPTARGSLRTVRHFRGSQLVQEVDLYELLLHGLRNGVQRLESGDSVLVPPVGKQITVEGMVLRPAIYELRGETSLAQCLGLAGGVLKSAALRRIAVERVVAHERRIMLSYDLPEDSADGERGLAEFQVEGGDRVRVSPILPYSFQSLYLEGHVFRPGKYPYTPGMRVRDLIPDYSQLLPEPFPRHAEIVRLRPPDYHPEVLAFNLADALAGGNSNLPLQPFDTVRVFGRYDFEDPPRVTVRGEVRQPGEYRTNGDTHVADAIYLAGGVTPDSLLEDAQIYRRRPGSKLEVLNLNLSRALAGEAEDNLLLASTDVLVVHRNPARVEPAQVYIWGEVAVPGPYPLGEGMTASELVRLAGGLKRSAFVDTADLSRSVVQNGQRVKVDHLEVKLARALSGAAGEDVLLRDGDTLTVRQMEGWQDRGAAVTLRGELVHPGTYGLRERERLSSVLLRAGGFRAGAYPAAAVLERAQVRELAQRSREQMIRRIEQEPAQFSFPAGTTETQRTEMGAAFQQQRRQVLARLRSEPVSGRLVIRIGGDLRRWQNTADDVELRPGDVLTVPKAPNFVVVEGQVYNPTAISYSPGKSADWYLRQAGGPTEFANRKNIFVVRANGSVLSANSGGWWRGDVLSATLQPGDAIVVPERIMAPTPAWRKVMEAASVVTAAAFSARLLSLF
jgi:protein involved in polysaccharide export with SLBB domain